MLTFPRWVHQAPGVVRLISDTETCEQALADGWSLSPVPVCLAKGDETVNVYTAEAIAVAMAQGWAATPLASQMARAPKGKKK